MTESLTLEFHKEPLAIVKIAPGQPVPDWATAENSEFLSITTTPDELSIVCSEDQVPDDTSAERGWAALKIIGPLSFDQVGIIASLASPLKEAGIPIFVISTYDTDYLLVKEPDVDATTAALERAGHVFR